MSHLVTVETQVTNKAALDAACRRLQLAQPVHGAARVYQTEVRGEIVRLPNWSYPVVFDLESGKVHYDNYGGSWGKQDLLDGLLQRYGVDAAIQAAVGQGYAYEEIEMPNNEIKLRVHMGDATDIEGAPIDHSPVVA